MPEGDSIFRAARTLHRALAGSVVTRFESVFPALTRVDDDTPLAGRTVESVESIGKHLLMHFSGDLILRTHMRMNGSWHIYRPGERWLRPRRDMRIVIETGGLRPAGPPIAVAGGGPTPRSAPAGAPSARSCGFAAVGFSIPVAEFLTNHALGRHDELRQLGPDLLDEGFDSQEAFRRAREHAADAIADALLNQRVMAGVGNVYKSEVLFICGVSPFRRVADVSDAELENLIATARRLLRINVSTQLAPMTTYTGLRRTTGSHDPSERLWVYGRARRPCRKCGTVIEVKPQGPDARLTYWCPKCQEWELGARS
jgi:endonuclease VIII